MDSSDEYSSPEAPADPTVLARLRTAFAHYDEDEVWDALTTTMDIFGDVARRTAVAFDLAYSPVPEQRARELVADLRASRQA